MLHSYLESWIFFHAFTGSQRLLVNVHILISFVFHFYPLMESLPNQEIKHYQTNTCSEREEKKECINKQCPSHNFVSSYFAAFYPSNNAFILCQSLLSAFVLWALRHLAARSFEGLTLKPCDMSLNLSDPSDTWQVPLQHCCVGICQMSSIHQSIHPFGVLF